MRVSRLLIACLLPALLLAGCGGKNKDQVAVPGSSDAPDKILFENAKQDIAKGRHTIARLTLQTLINSYPDSEYLAQAKLMIADSFYTEGGTAGLTQAVAEYKDFITFFPFLPEAAYAQLQVGRSHYRRMEKPDRDRTQARLAEQELQEFILKYPNSPLLPEAEQRLREVQEVLAEGDFRVGRFYYLKDTPNAYRAAIFRLAELTDRYPLYSQADKALWMLGDSLQRLEQSQMAGKYYARIVRDYPLSPLVERAKERLVALGVPIPQPDPIALERMQKEQSMPRPKRSILRRGLGIMRSGPDVSTAARVGQPNLTPPSETPSESLVAGAQATLSGSTGSSVVVETVPSTSATGAATSGKPEETSAKPPADSSATGTSSTAKTDPKQAEKQKKEEEKKKESSSKKKKGLRKIIPW